MKKVSELKKCIAAALLLAAAVMLTSCVDGLSNDGSLSGARLAQGYKVPVTTDKFWKDYAPYYEIQLWGMGANETYGRTPTIDFEEGTLTNTDEKSGGTCMPVFGAFDLQGDYYVKNIKSFECDVWGEGADSMELEISVYHATANTKKPKVTTELQHISIDLVQ